MGNGFVGHRIGSSGVAGSYEYGSGSIKEQKATMNLSTNWAIVSVLKTLFLRFECLCGGNP